MKTLKNNNTVSPKISMLGMQHKIIHQVVFFLPLQNRYPKKPQIAAGGILYKSQPPTLLNDKSRREL